MGGGREITHARTYSHRPFIHSGWVGTDHDSFSPGAAGAAPAGSSVEHGGASSAPNAPLVAVTAAMWAERASAMLPLDAQGPVASKAPRFAVKGFIDLAFGAINKPWQRSRRS